MAVKIRLQRKGRKKFPFYHIVIADSRAPRDGKFIENIGIYNPMTKPATIDLDRDKAYTWLQKGAQPTETVRAILRFKGVLYKKHLMDGVIKGAHTEEQALEKWNQWLDVKEARIRARFEKTAAEKEALRKAISGTVPKIKIKEEAPAEEIPAAEEAAAAESPAEETPVAEEAAPVEAPAEESPVAEEATAAESPVEETSIAEEAAPAEPAEETPVAEEAAPAEVLAEETLVVEKAPAEETPAVEGTAPADEATEEEEKPGDEV
jgi:small subunit ribosomal protein S16